MSKRKRSTQIHAVAKRPKLINPSHKHSDSLKTLQPLLADCYDEVKNLKDYVFAVLPASSRVRRKRLLSFTESPEHAQFFTTTLVGIRGEVNPVAAQRRLGDVALFTQTCRTDRGLSATSQQWSIDEVSYLSGVREILTLETGR